MPAPVADADEPPALTGVAVDAVRLCVVMQALGIEEHLCDAAAGVLMDEHSDKVDVALLPRVMRAAGVPTVPILHTVCGVMQVGRGVCGTFPRCDVLVVFDGVPCALIHVARLHVRGVRLRGMA